MVIIHTTWGYIGLALMLALSYAIGLFSAVLIGDYLRRLR